MEQMLTVEQAAKLLQVDAATVEEVIATGKLPCLRLGGAVRLRRVDLESYVHAEMESQQQEVFARVLANPRSWAKAMDEATKASYLSTDFPPGSMGRFLKEGILAVEAERASDNVVDLHDPRRK